MHQQAKQAADEPAEVQQRREQVAAERVHPDRVQEFRVRRVEPGQELRRDVVQVPGVPGLAEPGRERPVVPGAVEPGHAGAQLQLHFGAEMHHRCRRDDQGDQGCDAGRPGRRVLSGDRGGPAGGPSWSVLGPPHPRATRRRSVQIATPTAPTTQQIGHRLEGAEGAEQLGDPDQESERQDRGREMGRGAREAQGRGACGRPSPPARRSRRERRSRATPSR